MASCLFLTFLMDAINDEIPIWLGSQWHLTIIISLQILSSHGILVISNKWAQGTTHINGKGCYGIIPGD